METYILRILAENEAAFPQTLNIMVNYMYLPWCLVFEEKQPHLLPKSAKYMSIYAYGAIVHMSGNHPIIAVPSPHPSLPRCVFLKHQLPKITL